MRSEHHSIRLAAPAKINLSLRILGKRSDGFHQLETLMAPLRLADQIEICHAPGHDISLLCNDPSLPTGAENLCVQAAERFFSVTGLKEGLSITLMKKIPHGAGLGGGSSDAAAVLKGVNQLFDKPLVKEELQQIAAELGSDVSFFLHEGAAWCRGRGERMEAAPILPARTLLLIKPPFPVPTAWAYKRYDELKEKGVKSSREGVQRFGELVIENDLETPVFEKYLLLPVMKRWLREQSGVESVFMTGSGSTMVAVIAPDVQKDSLNLLKEGITSMFGPKMWMVETEILF